MVKKIIQDIYVVKKSIRMIKKSDVRDGFYSEIKKPMEEKKPDNDLTNKFFAENNTNNEHEYIEEKKHVTKDSLIFLWIICIVSVATLLFLLSSKFSTATLTITPKSKIVVLNNTYNITSDKSVSSSTLHYEVMTIKKDLSKIMQTDGEEYVERKARGRAILYNNFSTSNQKLINNTRLETKEGLIYRIGASVDVPGIKIINGVKTPGSVEVEIIADMPGDKYNMRLSDFKGDFTIPGFKGSTKYTTFYGRLNTDVTGGFIGNVKKVSDDQIKIGRTWLRDNLKKDLIKEIYAKKPDQYVLFKNNYYLKCNDLADNSSSGEYKINEECSISAIIFNKNALATFIAVSVVKDFDNSKADIIWNDDNDTVVLSGTTEKPWNETSLKAKFTGPVQIVWSYDVDAILNSIIGQDKSVVSLVIEKNKNSLTEIQATIRPVWKNTFPENDKKIKIVDTVRGSII